MNQFISFQLCLHVQCIRPFYTVLSIEACFCHMRKNALVNHYEIKSQNCDTPSHNYDTKSAKNYDLSHYYEISSKIVTLSHNEIKSHNCDTLSHNYEIKSQNCDKPSHNYHIESGNL